MILRKNGIREEYTEYEKIQNSARGKARRAEKTGKLIRRPCEKCGSTERLERHHLDYSKPLDVVWLCGIHHKAVHVEQRRATVPQSVDI